MWQASTVDYGHFYRFCLIRKRMGLFGMYLRSRGLTELNQREVVLVHIKHKIYSALGVTKCHTQFHTDLSSGDRAR